MYDFFNKQRLSAQEFDERMQNEIEVTARDVSFSRDALDTMFDRACDRVCEQPAYAARRAEVIAQFAVLVAEFDNFEQAVIKAYAFDYDMMDASFAEIARELDIDEVDDLVAIVKNAY